MSEHDDSPKKYIVIWLILLVLLAISIAGPMLGILWLTLLTAFGIAVVKAWMVAAYFMHLNIEKKIATYVLVTMLFAVSMFFLGVSPDVMKVSGNNWVNKASNDLSELHRHVTGAPH
jgi:caa(3)-type oxidase subunit IV